MILVETKYKTHDGELLAIIKAFKTWKHYLEGSQNEILVLTDYNKLPQFMDTKSLSSREVRWAQELSHYYFRIDYCQNKANRAADALFQYPQQNAEEEDALRAKNVKILHYLQSSLTNASLSNLMFSKPSPLQQVFVCGTHVLPKLCQFWNSFQSNIALDSPYIANIGGMRLQLSALQENDKEAKLLKGSADLLQG